MKITEEILARYWNEACSEEERKAVEAWLVSNEREPDQLDEALISNAQDNVWEDLQATIGQKEEAREVSLKFPLYNVIKYAAACLLLLGLGAMYFAGYSGRPVFEAAASQELQLVLSIPEQDKVARVDQGCVVQFEGVLSLHNP
ncbi:MAG: hypothetical protein AAGA85_27405, partial [Bacteroidota bacterium]